MKGLKGWTGGGKAYTPWGADGQKGQGKGGLQGFQGYCNICRQWGHKAVNCPQGRSRGNGNTNGLDQTGQEQPAEPQSSSGSAPGTLGSVQQIWTIMAVDKDADEVTPPPGLVAGMEEEGETIEVTVDSGAMDTVGPMSAGAGFETYETEASRNGRNFRAANGTFIKNYGEKKILGSTEDGRTIQMRMTVADVGKVLMSVAKVCESGYRVVFDEEGSYMEEKRSGTRTKLHKKNGVYVMNLRTESKKEQQEWSQAKTQRRNGSENRTAGFARQGTQTYRRHP